MISRSGLDFFIYSPIEKDTSPLALISALASGLPVSFSDIDSLKEMKKADCLIVMHPKNGRKGVFTGKLFEYYRRELDPEKFYATKTGSPRITRI